MTKRIFEKFGFVGILVLCLISVLVLQNNRLKRQEVVTSIASDDHMEAVQMSAQLQLDLWKRTPSLGFQNLMADWFFLSFLQYFGDDAVRSKTGYGLSPDFFEAIIPRDPFYRPFYLFLSGSSSLYAALPDRTVALMNEGLSRMTPEVPEDGFLVWRYKGTDELLFLGDAQAAQQSFQTAADWAGQSAQPEAQAVAAISQRTADFLANNPVSKRAQVDAWAGIVINSFDENTQKLAIQRIEALGGRVNITEDGQVQIGYPEED